MLAVPLGGMRLDFRGRELARQRLDLPLVRGQLEVHAGEYMAVLLVHVCYE
jgi:hypothetical protein